MAQFVAYVFSGVSYGAILALVALGFVVLFKATGVVNFAHGDLVTLGGYVTYWAVTTLALPVVAGELFTLVLMFGVGIVLERVAYAPLRKRPTIIVVLATLAAAYIIRGFVSEWQGSTPKSLPGPVGSGVVDIFGASIADQRLLIIGVAAVVVTALLYVFHRTSFGRQVRALAADPEAARLSGVRTRRVAIVMFGLSASLGALAGMLIAPLTSLSNDLGFNLMVAAFGAAVIGGFGSLGGVIVGSLIIGLAQQVLGAYLFPSYATAVPYVLIILLIAARPQGLVSAVRARL